MPFNLIADRWLPCRRHGGSRVWLSPGEITSDFADNPVLALDFPRPDWNAAVTELLIGLVTAAMPAEGTSDWAKLWIEPPSVEMLTNALAPLAFAFVLDGDGPRAFQDMTPLADGELETVENLIFRDNHALFFKDGTVRALEAPHAAAALITLQSYASGGGRGHMANPRKKGPLSSLITATRKRSDQPVTTLWDRIWPNVLSRELAYADSVDLVEILQERSSDVFPWLREPVPAPLIDDGLPGFAKFFSQPRRIRLEWRQSSDALPAFECEFPGLFVAYYRTRPNGHRYSAWMHPLSPYRVSPGELPRAVPVPEIQSYENWQAIWGIEEGHKQAVGVALWSERLGGLRFHAHDEYDLKIMRQQALTAWGIRSDRKLEMKVLGFLDERIPYFEAKETPGWATKFQGTVSSLVAGAKEAANALQYELRRCRFAKRTAEGDYKLPDTAPRKAFEDDAAALWRQTEPAFRHKLEMLHDGDPADASMELRQAFHGTLRTTALRLFDAASNIDTLADQDAKRIVVARRALFIALSGNGKVAKALGIVEAKPAKSGKGTGKKGRE